MRVAVACAIGALAGSALVGVAPAQAFPSLCSSWYHNPQYGASIVCHGGTGQYRVSVKCDGGIFPWQDYRRYSEWRAVGTGHASAGCNWFDRASDLREELFGPV
jgi:hypothetical protein